MIFQILLTLFFFQDSWQPFVSIEGQFSVDVPAPMIHHIEKISTPIGEVDYHAHYLKWEGAAGGNFVFVVSYYVSPSLRIMADSTDLMQDFFQTTVDQARQRLGGEVLILDDIVYKNKYPGKFWRIHYNGGKAVMRSKVYLVEDRYYSVQVAVDDSYSLSKEVDHFMDSFRIIEDGTK